MALSAPEGGKKQVVDQSHDITLLKKNEEVLNVLSEQIDRVALRKRVETDAT